MPLFIVVLKMTVLDTITAQQVPLLPKSHAVIYLIVNCFFAGLGTIFAGFEAGDNETVLIGVIQFLTAWLLAWTIVGFFIGWLWSIYWTILMIVKADKEPGISTATA
jgi:hypothetical protein